MKDKLKWLVPVIVLLVLAIGGTTYFILNREDKDTTLTLIEKQWIEKNKVTVFDISVLNRIPIINYNGEGIVFDFLKDLESATGLEFNRVAYSLSDESAPLEYALKKVEEVEDNQLLMYTDHYVLLTKENKHYNKISEIEPLKVGVLKEDEEKVKKYLDLDNTLTFNSYDKLSDLLIGAFGSEQEKIDPEVDAIVLLETTYLKEILENNLSIAYHITEYDNHYVLTLGSNDKLNTIISKFFRKWMNEKYDQAFSKYLTNNYFRFSGKEQDLLTNKRYVYGFVLNEPYDILSQNDLMGTNYQLLNTFSRASNVEFSYKRYSSIENLLKEFNENKVDFFYNPDMDYNYEMDTLKSADVTDVQMAILSSLENNEMVNSILSLEGKKVFALKNTNISKYLIDNNIEVELFDNVRDLLENIKVDSTLALDRETYDYYKNTKLKKYKIDYEESIGNYYFVFRDINNNDSFNSFFQFYMTYYPIQTFKNNALLALSQIKISKPVLPILFASLGIVALIVLSIFLVKQYKKPTTKKQKNLSKEDKLRYIDMLTSLKNRNYLNDHIEQWDESEVYPQAIVIVDLNNVAYINDNYGHTEGDNVIREAANILILNQLPNTEIIRTNGNEFLIYLVGYDEKQVVVYIRKLNKKFTELAHGFGAATGYSMILDGIKTVDDAVNEATLDMRNNKEEANN